MKLLLDVQGKGKRPRADLLTGRHPNWRGGRCPPEAICGELDVQASHHDGDVVLVVEDDAVQCAEIADYLREKGYEVATAGDAYEGLATLADTQPRVLVADINMPNWDGIRMAEVASNLDHTLSVIFISGDERALQRARWEDISAVATLPKPIPLHQLEAMIRAIVGT